MDVFQEMFKIKKGNYRMFGNPYQTKVYNMDDLYNNIKKNNGENPCFVSVCQYDPFVLLEYVPFDFDGINAKEDAKKLIKFFDDNDIYSYVVIFSGGGYHVYLKVVPHHYTGDIIGSFQSDLINGLHLPSADEHLIGDIKRMMRIPNTINEKYGTVCQFIKTDGVDLNPSLDLLFWQSHAFKRKVNYTRENNDINEGEMDDTQFNELHSFPCLKYWMQSIEPPHMIRVYYVIWKLAEGYSVDDIINDLKGYCWRDWDEEYTRYQVEYIKNGRYRMVGCKKIKEHGYCIRCKENR